MSVPSSFLHKATSSFLSAFSHSQHSIFPVSYTHLFDAQIVADAGVIVLGNINASRFNVNQNMMKEVSSVFSESASLDRFHGFIPGWKIPRMHQGLVANGWALNTEYFAEVLHLLRDDLTYTTIVDECLDVYKRQLWPG